MENSIEEDMKILKEIIKGDEDCINAIHSQMKVKNDNDEDIQYFKKEIQSIKNIVNNYLKEKARADKLEKEYSIMLSQLDEREINYKRALKENEILKKEKEQAWEEWNNLEQGSYETEQKLKQQIKESQRENEELKERIREHTLLISPYYVKENYIPIQKIKDKIEEENLPLVIVGGRRNKRTLEYGIKLGRRQALQELLGSEE